MKEIKMFEEIRSGIRSGKLSPREAGVPSDLFLAYDFAIANGNDLIDMTEVIWDNQVEEISNALVSAGISEFTISSAFSSLIDILAGFAKYGWNMSGLVVVNSRYKNFGSNEFDKINAIKLTYKEV